MTNNDPYLRIKLKAKLEANRISRLGLYVAEKQLKKWEKERENASGKHLEQLQIKISTLQEKIEEQEEAKINQTFAEYNDGHGFNFAGGSGCDNG